MENLEKRKNKIISLSIGLVYLIFGFLKLFPGTSPAEELATNTIQVLTFGFLPSYFGFIALALFESFIGICLILNWQNKLIIYAAIAHITCTFTPLFLFPGQIFGENRFIITLLSQYIFKNIIILGALFTLKIDLESSKKKSMKRKLLSLNLFSEKMGI
ncbi:hypothetical protein [Maribacter arcticus]|uniref:Doxx family protein n=1 Tax=Maribacter arcticus TaxID=561365 RepID=A0A1T5ERW0_9FLAO|nr:hypothetical protein [Maribacter arcticus]SKB86671.1 hypothetical protein SAMN05660866_03659 [Maribacter arcticus]